METLSTNLRYLYSGTVDTGAGSLDYLVGLVRAVGGPRSVKQVLSGLRPNEEKDDSVVLVRRRDRPIKCDAMGCYAIFAEKKELYRHKRVVHTSKAANANEFICGFTGCSRSFKTEAGWCATRPKFMLLYLRDYLVVGDL